MSAAQSGAVFADQLAFARNYEKAVAAWLMRRGWRVLPTYDFSGADGAKAPKLTAHRPADSLVLPDLMACRDGVSRWVEVKWKKETSFHRKTKTVTTGLSLRLWNHYREAVKASGLRCWIVFVHEREREMRGGEITELLSAFTHEYNGFAMGPGGMVFFAWDKLQKLATLAEIRGDARFAGELHHDAEVLP